MYSLPGVTDLGDGVASGVLTSAGGVGDLSLGSGVLSLGSGVSWSRFQYSCIGVSGVFLNIRVGWIVGKAGVPILPVGVLLLPGGGAGLFVPRLPGEGVRNPWKGTGE